MSSCRALCSCALTVLIALGGTSAAAQDRAAEPGPLEKRANPITLENPIPRRIYFVMPQNPPELGTTIARAVVTLRITLDESGRVGEARQTCCDLVSQDSARGSDIGAFVAFRSSRSDSGCTTRLPNRRSRSTSPWPLVPANRSSFGMPQRHSQISAPRPSHGRQWRRTR